MADPYTIQPGPGVVAPRSSLTSDTSRDAFEAGMRRPDLKKIEDQKLARGVEAAEQDAADEPLRALHQFAKRAPLLGNDKKINAEFAKLNADRTKAGKQALDFKGFKIRSDGYLEVQNSDADETDPGGLFYIRTDAPDLGSFAGSASPSEPAPDDVKKLKIIFDNRSKFSHDKKLTNGMSELELYDKLNFGALDKNKTETEKAKEFADSLTDLIDNGEYEKAAMLYQFHPSSQKSSKAESKDIIDIVKAQAEIAKTFNSQLAQADKNIESLKSNFAIGEAERAKAVQDAITKRDAIAEKAQKALDEAQTGVEKAKARRGKGFMEFIKVLGEARKARMGAGGGAGEPAPGAEIPEDVLPRGVDPAQAQQNFRDNSNIQIPGQGKQEIDEIQLQKMGLNKDTFKNLPPETRADLLDLMMVKAKAQ